jgi:hypothetical protein
VKVKFLDHQDRGNPLNGTEIVSRDALSRVLDGLRGREPFFCEIVGENGFKLLLGVGADYSCAQHSPSDGSTPYLMAVADPDESVDEFQEFLTANTLTPVPKRYCLSFDRMKEIALHFLEYGDRVSGVTWEEI